MLLMNMSLSSSFAPSRNDYFHFQTVNQPLGIPRFPFSTGISAPTLIKMTLHHLTFLASVASGEPSSDSSLSGSININLFVMDTIM